MNEQIINSRGLESGNQQKPSGTLSGLRPGENSLVREQKIILALSLPLAALLIGCSTIGLLYPNIYHFATPYWITQTVIQDGVNLFLVTPVLLVSALYSFQGVKLARLMWGGTVGYMAFTFLIYCFSVPVNILFIPYCFVVALSVYSLGWFVVTQVRTPVISTVLSAAFQKLIGIYFIGISSLFCTLWLLGIIPASFLSQLPKSVEEVVFVTSPVHLVDFSLFLSAVFLVGVMSIKGRTLSTVLIPVVLIFLILMDITISALIIVMMQNGYGGSMVLALAMDGLALINLILLIVFIIKEQGELSS